MNEDSVRNLYPKALIIDDEIDTCLLLGMLLKKFGISSVIAHNLADGFAMLMTEKPLIIFLDNDLPDGRGIEYIEQIKKQIPNSKLVMMTAMSSLSKQALNLGADGFIEKPLDIYKIERILHQ
jgi:DNA-binding response OmpR family regulator